MCVYIYGARAHIYIYIYIYVSKRVFDRATTRPPEPQRENIRRARSDSRFPSLRFSVRRCVTFWPWGLGWLANCSTILYYTMLYYTVLYYTILYYTILCHTILCYTTLYCTILYYTMLYYTVLYYTILYCTMHPPQAASGVTRNPPDGVSPET